MIQKILAPAKVNLGLKIVRKREDGYHNIVSLVHAIDIADSLLVKIESAPMDSFELSAKLRLPTGTAKRLRPNFANPTENLIFQGFRQLREDLPRLGMPDEVKKVLHNPLAIQVDMEKHIPSPSGLGGGTSDMAALFYGLGRYLEKIHAFPAHAFLESILPQSEKWAADLPFFLTRYTQIEKSGKENWQCIAGIGKTTTIEQPGQAIGVLGVPPFGFSTATMFQAAWEIILKNRQSASPANASKTLSPPAEKAKLALQNEKDLEKGLKVQSTLLEFLQRQKRNSEVPAVLQDYIQKSKEDDSAVFVANDFFEIAKTVFPEETKSLKQASESLQKAMRKELKTQTLVSSMSGSGPAFYTLSFEAANQKHFKNTIREMKKIYPDFFWKEIRIMNSSSNVHWAVAKR